LILHAVSEPLLQTVHKNLNRNKFEGDHPVVNGQLFTILVPSLHNI